MRLIINMSQKGSVYETFKPTFASSLLLFSCLDYLFNRHVKLSVVCHLFTTSASVEGFFAF